MRLVMAGLAKDVELFQFQYQTFTLETEQFIEVILSATFARSMKLEFGSAVMGAAILAAKG